MRIGAIVPHMIKFGGIRRFVEIGNEFTKRGADFHLYVGNQTGIENWKTDFTIRGWDNIDADKLLIGDPPSFKMLRGVKPESAYIYVIAGGRYIPQYREMYGRYPLVVNNRKFLDDFPEAFLVEGGVSREWKSRTVRVGYHYRKGSHIDKVLRGIPGIRLIPIQGLDDETLQEVYHSLDVFVTWETRTGWANMAAEAIQCGVPVVGNGVNCEPFIKKVHVVDDLRAYFEDPLKGLYYEDIVNKLETLFNGDYYGGGLEVQGDGEES